MTMAKGCPCAVVDMALRSKATKVKITQRKCQRRKSTRRIARQQKGRAVKKAGYGGDTSSRSGDRCLRDESRKKPPDGRTGRRKVTINNIVMVAATVYRRARRARPG